MYVTSRPINSLVAAAIAAAYPAVGLAAGSATVDFSVGTVLAISPSGASRTIGKGATLLAGETIRTGEDGRAQLRFSDGALMSLQPKTEFRIDEFVFNGKPDGKEKGLFTLITGGFRTITGLVGRVNRDAYKVNTAVATVGIRGTEYSVLFTGGTEGKLSLATGEGSIEVCNQSGCVIVAGGDSAVVNGIQSEPKRTETRPQLSAAPVTSTATPVFSTSEDRAGNGLPALLSKQALQTGPGYAIAYVGTGQGGGPEKTDPANPIDASFGAGGDLTGFANSPYTYASTSAANSITLNGSISWGRWATGTSTYGSEYALNDFHYVAGKPTSSADLTSLGGLVAYYDFAGATLPTSTTGLTGKVQSDSKLTIDFASASVDLNLKYQIGGNSYNANITGANLSGAGFSGSGDGAASGSFTFKGFVAGANAVNAGLVFKDQAGGAIGDVTGAVVFKQTSTATSGGGGI